MSLVVPGHGYTLGLNGEVPSGVDRQGMATAKAPPADATRRRPQRRNPKPAPPAAQQPDSSKTRPPAPAGHHWVCNNAAGPVYSCQLQNHAGEVVDTWPGREPQMPMPPSGMLPPPPPRAAPPAGMMYSQEDPDFGVSQMSDEELQEAMSALKPDFLDQMIQRLEPKKQSPQKTADMVKPDYQQAWKWDGNQVRALSEEEQAAQAKADAIAARRDALRAQKALNQRNQLKSMRQYESQTGRGYGQPM